LVGEVPQFATQGIGPILRAGFLGLAGFGQAKVRAIASAVARPLTASSLVSGIQFYPSANVFVDEQAASELVNSEYYARAFDQRLEWEWI
jgi:6-phosphogluconolactonase/glucosamine-6-phosphate isomerase/deaminase